MPATEDLDLLIDAAREAGRIATGFAGRSARKWDKPGGAGPVTEADLAVNDMLQDQLRSARPDYGWLSEESDDNDDRLTRNRVFVIDPIDGTRSFVEGSRTWAHALAVVEDGLPIAAVIYLPMRDMLYSAAIGQGARLNGERIQPSAQTQARGAQVLAARPTTKAHHWAGPVPPFERAYRPSLAYRMALVAQGRFDAMLTLRPTWEWDIAAGDLLLREAGATTSDRLGAPLRFNSPEGQVNGVLAGGPALHAILVDALDTDTPTP